MNNGYTTTSDIFFATALAYIFTEAALQQIEFVEDNGKRITNFQFDAPECDCAIYQDEFKTGNLAISDLLAYVKIYNRIVAILKRMRQDGDTLWNSRSWICGGRRTTLR